MLLSNRLKWAWLAVVASLLAMVSLPGHSAFASTSALTERLVDLPLGVSINLDQPISGKGPVADTFKFSGLAYYLNAVSFYLIDNGNRTRLRPGTTIALTEGQTFVATGRFNALVIRSPQAEIRLNGDVSLLLSQESQTAQALTSWLVFKSELAKLDPTLNQLRYAQLPGPLAVLSRGFEWMLVKLQELTNLSWGLSLIVFAALIKLLLIPVARVTQRLQNTVDSHQRAMRSQIALIKKKYHGEDAHNRIMALHKERNITPFYTLKPMLGLFIQIPVVITIFNVLGETHQFTEQDFLWIRDMANPDALASLPFNVPFFGNTFNALPFLMALVAGISALRYSPPHSDDKDKESAFKKRLSLLAMGIAFLILFYPFPATMTLYWLLINLFHLAKR